MKKIIYGCLLFILTIFCVSIPSMAADTYPFSVPTLNYGLLPKKGNKIITWENAVLEYNIKEYPSNFDAYLSNNPNYLTSTYKMTNHSGIPYKETFYLPYKEIKELGRSFQTNTKIKVNDMLYDPTIRQMYYMDEFDFYYDGIQIKGPNSYNPNNSSTPVYKVQVEYDFQEGILEDEVKLILPKNQNAKVFINKNYSLNSTTDSSVVSIEVSKWNDSFTMFFIGAKKEFSFENDEHLQLQEEEMTLSTFANAYRPSNYNSTDWLTIILEKLSTFTNDSYIQHISLLTSLDNIINVMEFTVDFEVNESVEITTITPLYPIPNALSSGMFRLSGLFYGGIQSGEVKVSGKGMINEIGGTLLDNETMSFSLDSAQTYYTFNLNSNTNHYEYDIDSFPNEFIITTKVVLILFFYVIPMIIMAVLFLLKKNKKPLVFPYIEKFVSFTLFFFGLYGIIFFPESLPATAVLFSISSVLFIFTALETILKKTRNYNRLKLTTICTIISIFYLCLKQYESVLVCLWVSHLLYFVFDLLYIQKKKKNPDLDTYLPVGILHTYELVIGWLYVSCTFSLSMILVVLYGSLPYLFLAIFLILVGYVVGVLILRQYGIVLKPFQQFQRDLDIDALESKVLSLQNLPELHPETKNYYTILLVQYFIGCDKEKFRFYLKKSYMPKTKGYIIMYRGMMLRYGTTKNEFEHAYATLKREFYKNKNFIKMIDKFHTYWQPYYGTNPKVDVTFYKWNRKKNEYSNAIALFVLIYYYKNEGNVEKVEELKQIFLNKYSMFHEFVKDLDMI